MPSRGQEVEGPGGMSKGWGVCPRATWTFVRGHFQAGHNEGLTDRSTGTSLWLGPVSRWELLGPDRKVQAAEQRATGTG